MLPYPLVVPDLTLLPTFFIAIVHDWVAAMSGVVGVGLFIASLIAEWRQKPITFRLLFAFALCGFGVSAFEVWRNEYVTNSGKVTAYFYLADPESVISDNVQEQITLINTSSRIAVIRNISMGRVYMVDKSFLHNIPSRSCKDMYASPEEAERVSKLTNPSLGPIA